MATTTSRRRRRLLAAHVVLPPQLADNERRVRFEREVQHTAQLAHHNTVAVYDYGTSPDGAFYYAMEFVDGITLFQMVELTGPVAPQWRQHRYRR